jgi:hypothetical protein
MRIMPSDENWKTRRSDRQVFKSASDEMADLLGTPVPSPRASPRAYSPSPADQSIAEMEPPVRGGIAQTKYGNIPYTTEVPADAHDKINGMPAHKYYRIKPTHTGTNEIVYETHEESDTGSGAYKVLVYHIKGTSDYHTYCDCPSWKYQKGKAPQERDCKHTERAFEKLVMGAKQIDTIRSRMAATPNMAIDEIRKFDKMIAQIEHEMRGEAAPEIRSTGGHHDQDGDGVCDACGLPMQFANQIACRGYKT